jgi:hypothetical protein
MIKLTPFIVTFGINPLLTFSSHNNIPYESLYEIEKANKNTLEYNYIRTEDLVKEKNSQLLKELFLDGIINEDTR